MIKDVKKKMDEAEAKDKADAEAVMLYRHDTLTHKPSHGPGNTNHTERALTRNRNSSHETRTRKDSDLGPRNCHVTDFPVEGGQLLRVRGGLPWHGGCAPTR